MVELSLPTQSISGRNNNQFYPTIFILFTNQVCTYMARRPNSFVICAITMTLSTIITRYRPSFAFQAGRFPNTRHVQRTYSSLSSSPLITKASQLRVSTYDSEETIGSLPYSTSTSKQVKPKHQTSSSTLPFSSPRNSFDDSLPSSYKGTNGVSEWSKLGLLTDLVDALTSPQIGLTQGPTPVQSMAIPEILSGCKERMAHVEIPQKPLRVTGKSDFDIDVNGGSVKDISEIGIPPVRSVAFAAATGE